MTRVPFNVNYYVWVRVTEYGEQILRENALNLFGPEGSPYKWERVKDERGFTRWQMWDLMQAFGRAWRMGGPVPFETTIEFDTESP